MEEKTVRLLSDDRRAKPLLDAVEALQNKLRDTTELSEEEINLAIAGVLPHNVIQAAIEHAGLYPLYFVQAKTDRLHKGQAFAGPETTVVRDKEDRALFASQRVAEDADCVQVCCTYERRGVRKENHPVEVFDAFTLYE